MRSCHRTLKMVALLSYSRKRVCDLMPTSSQICKTINPNKKNKLTILNQVHAVSLRLDWKPGSELKCKWKTGLKQRCWRLCWTWWPSCCMSCPHLLPRTWVTVPAHCKFQLSANVHPCKTLGSRKFWLLLFWPHHPLGELAGVAESLLWSGQDLTSVGIWGTEWHMEDLCFSNK